MATIKIENLVKSYGNKDVLDKINLTIEENKIYGLLGRNGAGKTTLLNLISNRIFPTEGNITIDNKNILKDESITSKIYFMAEKCLYPANFKIKDVFKWTKEFYENFDLDYALELSKRFDLNINKKIKSLSTGYLSICKVIVTLASGAEILIFDEPILGLDANHRDIFYKEIIANYIDEPKTIIISTHIIEEISDILEKVLIIKDGNVINDNEIDELREKAYVVSGKDEDVTKYIENKKCINIDEISGYKSATIIGNIEDYEKNRINDIGLTLSKIELQKLFIYLTREGEV